MDEVKLEIIKKLGETLTKVYMMWYSMLPKWSFNLFEHVTDFFVQAQTRSKILQERKVAIFKIAQKDNDLLQEFVIHLWREIMSPASVLNE